MDELLSDGEVSALLSELDVEGVGAATTEAAAPAPDEGVVIDEQGRRIKTYDFNRPNRFSKDHMRTLEMLHEIFARGFTASVAAYLRTVAEVRVVSVKQLPFREYTMALPRPDCIFVLKMDPLEGAMLLEISPELVLSLIDRILGGPGKAPNAPRELTDIEQSVIEKVIHRSLENLQEAWHKVGQFEPKLTGYETTAQFVQVVAPNEIAAVIEFEMKVNEVTGKMSMCIPYVVIEPMIGNLSAQKWFTVGKKDATTETIENLTRAMRETSIPLVVQAGSSQVSVRELLNMKAGDVVRLDTSPKGEITVLIENLIKLKGRPGVSSKKKAIQITKVEYPEERR